MAGYAAAAAEQSINDFLGPRTWVLITLLLWRGPSISRLFSPRWLPLLFRPLDYRGTGVRQRKKERDLQWEEREGGGKEEGDQGRMRSSD